MARRPERAAPPVVVLDSEALSAIAHPAKRSAGSRRAQAVLVAILRASGSAHVPAPVLAEVSRGPHRAGVDRILRRSPVVLTDRSIAERAGDLLERKRLDSCHAVDAFVVATAAALGNALILTGNPDDLRALADGIPGVAVQALP